MTQGSERTYTLDEAALELRKRECDRSGHDWDVVATLGGGPYGIVCGRCGWSGEVKMAATR